MSAGDATDEPGGVDPTTSGDASTGELPEDAALARGPAPSPGVGALALLLVALGRRRRA